METDTQRERRERERERDRERERGERERESGASGRRGYGECFFFCSLSAQLCGPWSANIFQRPIKLLKRVLVVHFKKTVLSKKNLQIAPSRLNLQIVAD